MNTLPPPEEGKPSPETIHFRKALEGEGSCQTCMNWGLDGECSVMGIKTLPVMTSDMFSPIEQDAAATAPADLGTDGLLQMLGGMG